MKIFTMIIDSQRDSYLALADDGTTSFSEISENDALGRMVRDMVNPQGVVLTSVISVDTSQA